MKNNKKTIECEVRGSITFSDFAEIKTLLERDWGKLDETQELVIFFKGEKDLRLKINKNGIWVIIKKTIKAKKHGKKRNFILKPKK